ncbi:unnamed protein product [Cercospora beticola]|nr:unnamed protein product [Cercospora beticola]
MTSRKLKRPTRLVLDYDGTITKQDTMFLLGNLPKQSTKLSWQEIVDAYVKDYTKWQNEKFDWKNYDASEYSAWLATRGWVELKSAQRVQDCGFFKGVTEDDVEKAVRKALASGQLELHKGWDDLFKLYLPEATTEAGNESSLEILSVNWSRTAIRHGLLADTNDSPLQALIGRIPVYANQIQGIDSPDGSTGIIVNPDGSDLRTNIDKINRLRKTARSPHVFTVYIGDSSTDFDCLWEADLGIWLYDVPEDQYEEASRKVFSPLKYVPPPLSSLKDLDGKKEAFYWAPNFKTVLDVLSCLKQ